jgi:hypothetical protein
MKFKRFLSHAERLVEGRLGGNAAREVGEVHAEIAVSILSDQTNIARHRRTYRLGRSCRPDWRRCSSQSLSADLFADMRHQIRANLLGLAIAREDTPPPPPNEQQC